MALDFSIWHDRSTKEQTARCHRFTKGKQRGRYDRCTKKPPECAVPPLRFNRSARPLPIFSKKPSECAVRPLKKAICRGLPADPNRDQRDRRDRPSRSQDGPGLGDRGPGSTKVLAWVSDGSYGQQHKTKKAASLRPRRWVMLFNSVSVSGSATLARLLETHGGHRSVCGAVHEQRTTRPEVC